MIILISVIFILFLIWTYNMSKGNFDNIDNKVYSVLKFNNLFTYFLKFITSFASTKFWIIILLFLIFFLKHKILAFTFVACILIDSCIIGLIKNIFKRKRPDINRLVKEHGFSYPSGHTMGATSFYGFVIFLIVTSPLMLSIKIVLISLLVLLILLIAFSRIYLGVHYFSDIIGGLLIGSSYILLFIFIVHNILNIV